MQRQSRDMIYQKGVDLFKDNKVGAALKIFLGSPRKNEFYYQIRIAECHRALDECDQALAILKSLEKKCRNDKDIYVLNRNLFRVYDLIYSSTKDKKYLPLMKSVLEKISNPDNTIQAAWARYYFQNGEYETALSYIDTLLKNSNDNEFKSYLNRLKARSLIAMNENKEVKEATEHLAELVMESDRKSVLNLYFLATTAPQHLSVLDLNNITIRRNDPSDLIKLAIIYEKVPDPNKAEEVYRELFNNFEFCWTGRLNYAYFLQKQDCSSQSIQILLPLVSTKLNCPEELKPTSKQLLDAYTSLTISYSALNDKNNALLYAKLGFEITPEHGPIRSAITKFIDDPHKRHASYKKVYEQDPTRLTRLHGKNNDPTPKVQTINISEMPALPSRNAASDNRPLRTLNTNNIWAQRAIARGVVIKVDTKPSEAIALLPKEEPVQKINEKEVEPKIVTAPAPAADPIINSEITQPEAPAPEPERTLEVVQHPKTINVPKPSISCSRFALYTVAIAGLAAAATITLYNNLSNS